MLAAKGESHSLAVLHEKHVELLDVGDCKLVKARGHAVARGLVGAVANFYIFCQPLGPESEEHRGRVSYQPRLLRCGRERPHSRGREASHGRGREARQQQVPATVCSRQAARLHGGEPRPPPGRRGWGQASEPSARPQPHGGELREKPPPQAGGERSRQAKLAAWPVAEEAARRCRAVGRGSMCASHHSLDPLATVNTTWPPPRRPDLDKLVRLVA